MDDHKCTPGPWSGRYDKYTGQGLVTSDASGQTVAVCYQTEADTLLEAAAPELLEALEAIMYFVPDWSVPTREWDKAVNAIRKAKEG